jgi:glutathione S-transferase
MALTFYYGSGSPYAWKVWLALEHKAIPYDAKRLSFDQKETQTPEFLKINPRGRVPAIVDNGFALSESNAITEYLDERNPEKPLLPKDVKERAVARRLIAEVASELEPIINPFSEATLYTKPEERDSKLIAEARAKLDAELARWADSLKGDFFAGGVGLVDYALFPWIRMLSRIEERVPGLRRSSPLGSPASKGSPISTGLSRRIGAAKLLLNVPDRRGSVAGRDVTRSQPFAWRQ